MRVLGEDILRHRYRVLPRMNFSSPFVDLPHRLTVRQNLLIYARLYGLSQRRERIESLAADLQIGAFLDRPAGKLSAGQKTRVALAKALLNEPELLLLDEPTASLDPDTGDWVRGYLEDWRARTGATILLASHNMAEVERLCSQVLMMKAGRIVDRGSPQALVERYGRANLEEVFLHIVRRSAARAGAGVVNRGGPGRRRIFAGPRLGDAAALSLSAAQLVAAHLGAALLADPADADLGVHEPVSLCQQQLRRSAPLACCWPR